MPEVTKTAVVAVTADLDRIEKILDVIEAISRCRLESTFPISALCMRELEQHGEAAQEELDALLAAEAEEAAAEAAKVQKEEAERIRKEEEANQPVAKTGTEGGGPPRRELPPLSPPPTR